MANDTVTVVLIFAVGVVIGAVLYVKSPQFKGAIDKQLIARLPAK